MIYHSLNIASVRNEVIRKISDTHVTLIVVIRANKKEVLCLSKFSQNGSLQSSMKKLYLKKEADERIMTNGNFKKSHIPLLNTRGVDVNKRTKTAHFSACYRKYDLATT